ncbi:MAG TPA: RNA 2',3'-cyclic phosphodiesterase [Acidobacteriaceae bacterium]|jgi:2'-5' RNA ligase|nr:RNA 2',3'-cyclic phosphodiesterase [Acidobacteriaceae bacterium]
MCALAPDLRWSAPESWHVTLQFLGQTSEEQAVCVVENLKTVHARAVPVQIAGLGCFDRAGVFWAGIGLTPELLALQQFVTTAMRRCAFVPEDRAYNPHITLARTKGRAGGKALAPLKKAVEKGNLAPHAEFAARGFVLYESLPGPNGSRYEIRERFALS